MAKLQITQSVGIGGVNKPNDIKAVQAALNKLLGLIPPTNKLVEDGKLGSKPENSKTVAAIKAFQKKVVGMVRPDGKIDANGKSHRKINDKLSALASAAVVPISGIMKAKLVKAIEQQEGRVPHMYLCTEGKVTVGVGHMMKDVKAAQKVPFVLSDSGKAASAQDIEDEFKAIKVRPFGKSEPHFKFKPFTKLIVSESLMDEQIDKHIKAFEKELKIVYGATEFSAYPNEVKLALFDMIFNLGMTTLKTGFPKFNNHIKNQDFKKAALECNRPQVSVTRNDYVRGLLRNAK
ncbi:hypothetical protein F9L16_15090 [Agarivorans sp. B2Z047]|uniref:hypothetical protein n=1 Tax=Agarivorans sp. B2Z047 TaxID=2652721 RepID=UPI00128BE0C8|nr:hypothetical protein [Agarivorans sp. B2Z047]MPW30311.1 hypothetical protein [Agarivorans sp. B2Z047]UQN43059.1 hypothetical protein LQZ07_00875 [Agarivorans sp. B2Z047]